MQAPHPRSTLLLAVPVALALLLAQGCTDGRPPEASGPAPAAAEAVEVGRFEIRSVALRRGPGILLRTDTATGQAWTMGVMEAPEWKALREGKAGVPSPEGTTPGRYSIRGVKQSRGAPTLVRSDSVTGRVWRKGAMSKGPWVAVPNPDPSTAPSEALAEPTAAEAPALDAPEDSDADPAEQAASL